MNTGNAIGRPGESPLVWLRHWRLTTDPFLGPSPPYVSTPGHDEAVARVAESIEARHERAQEKRQQSGQHERHEHRLTEI